MKIPKHIWSFTTKISVSIVSCGICRWFKCFLDASCKHMSYVFRFTLHTIIQYVRTTVYRGGYCWYSHHLKDGGHKHFLFPKRKLEWPTRMYTLADKFESEWLISSFWKCHLTIPKSSPAGLPFTTFWQNETQIPIWMWPKTQPDSVFSAPTIKLKIFKTEYDETGVPGGK